MKEKKRLYVDIHVLQTVPPSCVNRDDTGSPKTAIYGGITRARVSSQCWKHAMRMSMNDFVGTEEMGYRTKTVKNLLVKELEIRDVADADGIAAKILKAAGFKLADNGENVALFFISKGQIKALADNAKFIVDGTISEKELKVKCAEALKMEPGIDMALFGRMVADDPSLSYDAAAQVAHAISTHAVHTEYDYFSGVDDCASEDNAGAAHLGVVEFNSATL